jgi:hypothetical protein
MTKTRTHKKIVDAPEVEVVPEGPREITVKATSPDGAVVKIDGDGRQFPIGRTEGEGFVVVVTP